MIIEQEIIAIINQIPAAIEKAFVETLVLRHPGHGSQKVHGHRDGAIEDAKQMFLARATKLGHGNVQFKQGKGGKIEIHTASVKGGKLKKTKVYIDEKGRIISGKLMMTDTGWGQIK